MRLPAWQMGSGRAPVSPAPRGTHLDRMRSAGPVATMIEPDERPRGAGGRRPDRQRLAMVRGVGRALWRWKLRDPDQGPPERIAAGRIRGPDRHRRAGRDRPAWSGPGPVLAAWPAGPDPVTGSRAGRDPKVARAG